PAHRGGGAPAGLRGAAPVGGVARPPAEGAVPHLAQVAAAPHRRRHAGGHLQLLHRPVRLAADPGHAHRPHPLHPHPHRPAASPPRPPLRRFPWEMWLGVALATAAKGPVGIAVTLPAMGLEILATALMSLQPDTGEPRGLAYRLGWSLRELWRLSPVRGVLLS